MMDASWLCEPDEYGETLLSRVAKSGRMDLARLLIMQERNDAEEEDFSPMPALHRAAYWGYEKAVKNLLHNGKDPDELDVQGETPLHKAARLGHTEVVQTLLEAGADVNAVNSLGFTPLHWAALANHEEIVELLLEYGANAYARDWVSGGMTPLELARCMGFRELAKTLQYRMAII